jgi:dihydroorotate dehydrogenase
MPEPSAEQINAIVKTMCKILARSILMNIYGPNTDSGREKVLAGIIKELADKIEQKQLAGVDIKNTIDKCMAFNETCMNEWER